MDCFFRPRSANVQQACQLQIERRVLRARNRGSFRTRRGGFFRCGRRHCGGMRSSGAHRPRTVRPPRPRPGQARPHRRGIRQRPFAVSSVFSKHQGNGHTQAESVPSVDSSRYHMPPCPPEKLLLAFKYTRPGVVTVNSSILSLRAAKRPRQNRTSLRFCMVQCSQSPVRQHRGVCLAHARPRKRRL